MDIIVKNSVSTDNILNTEGNYTTQSSIHKNSKLKFVDNKNNIRVNTDES